MLRQNISPKFHISCNFGALFFWKKDFPVYSDQSPWSAPNRFLHTLLPRNKTIQCSPGRYLGMSQERKLQSYGKEPWTNYWSSICLSVQVFAASRRFIPCMWPTFAGAEGHKKRVFLFIKLKNYIVLIGRFGHVLEGISIWLLSNFRSLKMVRMSQSEPLIPTSFKCGGHSWKKVCWEWAWKT